MEKRDEFKSSKIVMSVSSSSNSNNSMESNSNTSSIKNR